MQIKQKITIHEGAQNNPQKAKQSVNQHNFFQKDVNKFCNKRTATTKHSSLNKNHRSTSLLYDLKQPLMSDAPSNYTQNLRKNKAHSFTRHNQKNRTLTQISLTHQQSFKKYFGRITIHCIKRKRQNFEKQSKSLESEYNYILKKISKLQRDKWEEQKKEIRQEIIQSKRKRQLSFLQNMKMSNQSIINQKKLQLKDQVRSHRMLKHKNLLKNKQEKILSGEQQRMKEEELHAQLCCIQMQKLQMNKIRCQKQKISKIHRQKKMKAQLQCRINAAKKNFKNKWVEQYEKQQLAKQQYQSKKEQIQEKIREALEYYKQIDDE